MKNNEQYLKSLIRDVAGSFSCELNEDAEISDDRAEESEPKPVDKEENRRTMAQVFEYIKLAKDPSASHSQTLEEVHDPSLPQHELVNASIVIIDDEKLTRQLLRVVFEEKGAIVTTAFNGRSALDLIKCRMEDGISFDLVLVDNRLPDMLGTQVIKELRNFGFQGGIISFSAYNLPSEVDGADATVQKSAGADGIVNQSERILRTFAKQSGGTIEMKSCD